MKKEKFYKIYNDEKEKFYEDLQEKKKVSKEKLKKDIKNYFEKYGPPRSKIELYENVHEAMRRSGSVNATRDISKQELAECVYEISREDVDISEAVQSFWENVRDE